MDEKKAYVQLGITG